jgi:hypothetical protein
VGASTLHANDVLTVCVTSMTTITHHHRHHDAHCHTWTTRMIVLTTKVTVRAVFDLSTMKFV